MQHVGILPEINKEICVNTDVTNEGHPTLLCGNLINHIVNDINRSFQNQHVKFEIFPVVAEAVDKRQNKFADYSIYRIWNDVTYIMIEVKLAVGMVLSSDESDSLAELFLEAYYIHV